MKSFLRLLVPVVLIAFTGTAVPMDFIENEVTRELLESLSRESAEQQRSTEDRKALLNNVCTQVGQGLIDDGSDLEELLDELVKYGDPDNGDFGADGVRLVALRAIAYVCQGFKPFRLAHGQQDKIAKLAAGQIRQEESLAHWVGDEDPIKDCCQFLIVCAFADKEHYRKLVFYALIISTSTLPDKNLAAYGSDIKAANAACRGLFPGDEKLLDYLVECCK